MEKAINNLIMNKEYMISECNKLCPRMKARGGGAVDIEWRVFPFKGVNIGSSKYSEYKGESKEYNEYKEQLVIYFLVDVQDSMGANTLNSLAEGMKETIESITSGRVRMGIMSNLCPERTAYASFSLPMTRLEKLENSGSDSSDIDIEKDSPKIYEGILELQELGEVDIFRATTHNKGILNGISAVGTACGQDIRGISAAAHAYAFYMGQGQGQGCTDTDPPPPISPLTKYSIQDNKFRGEIRIPIPVGVVGGATASSPIYKSCLKLLGYPRASELGEIMACVGLASNLAAMRAISQEGIQRGHMKLHVNNIVEQAIQLGAGSGISGTPGAPGAPGTDITDRLKEACSQYLLHTGSLNREGVDNFFRGIPHPLELPITQLWALSFNSYICFLFHGNMQFITSAQYVDWNLHIQIKELNLNINTTTTTTPHTLNNSPQLLLLLKAIFKANHTLFPNNTQHTHILQLQILLIFSRIHNISQSYLSQINSHIGRILPQLLFDINPDIMGNKDDWMQKMLALPFTKQEYLILLPLLHQIVELICDGKPILVSQADLENILSTLDPSTREYLRILTQITPTLMSKL